MRVLTLPKALRLTGKKEIDGLFRSGKSHNFFPLKLIFRMPEPSEAGSDDAARHFKVLFTVPSRRFKKATVRNRIRRLMREAFRQEQGPLTGLPPVHIGYIYIAPDVLSIREIRTKMIQSIRMLSQLHAKG